MNKKADLAVTLLVFMAVALAGAASVIFITNSGSFEAEIADARFIDKVYLKEGEINFYINEAMEKAVEDFNKEQDSEDKLINDFKQELGKYNLPELKQAGEQVDEIKIENNKTIAEFKIELRDEEEIFSVVYTYNKKFEKDL